jgi:hypothetical protein
MPLGAIDGDELRLYLADLAPTKVGRNWGDVIGIEYDRTHFHSPNRQKNPAFFWMMISQELSHSPTFPGEPTADRG